MRFNRTIPLVILTGLLAVAGLLGFLSLPARAAPAATWRVCQVVTCTYNTIQAAVDAAADGDTIQVAGGTYTDITARGGFNQVVYLSKTVTIVGGYSLDFSVQNPISYPTILNPDRGGRVVTIIDLGGAKPISPTLSDLQITGGDATPNGFGGGIFIQGAGPTLAYLKIYQNIASSQFTGYGGGIYMSNSNANILESDIYSNTASTAFGYSGAGGGIYINSGGPQIIGSHIANNVASTGGPGYGGGIALEFDQAFLDSNVIMNNIASPASGQPGSVFGGGVYMYQSLASLTYNLIASNQAATGTDSRGQGGGIYIEQQSNANLYHNTITANTASQNGEGSGGGVNLNFANATLNGNTISDNIASASSQTFHNSTGGGMYFSSDSSLLVNNVIARNVTDPNGGGVKQGDGIIMQGTEVPKLLHNTIYSNIGGDGIGIYVDAINPLQITNTIIASQTTGVSNFSGSVYLNGVLWFANGSDTGGLMTTTVNNAVTGSPGFAADSYGYHITWPSAARNAGVPIDTTGVYSPAAQDIDWEARPYPTDGLPDLGADELFMVWATLTPDDGGLMSYTDRPGMTITVDVPAGAVGVTTTLTCEPLDTLPAEPLPPDQLFAGRSFTLDVYQNMQLQEGFIFDQPVEVKVYYRDEDIVGIDEASLRLYYWDDEAGTWLDGANTCGTPAAYVRDPLNNFISVPICHLSRWDMHGVLPIEEENFLVYLPLAAKAP